MNTEVLLEKWLKDELTEAELELFKQSEDYQQYVDIIENAQNFKASQFSKADDFQTFKSNNITASAENVSLSWWKPLLRVAAIVVVTMGLYFTFFYNNLTEIATVAGEKTTVELPDASEVNLNALSQIEYNKRKWDSKRIVNLEGEAFFKVAKGKQFDVVTSDGIVTVVGTQFNVKQRKNFFEVKCFEGVVRVVSSDISRELTVGQTYKVLDGVFTEGQTDANIPVWITDRSHFEAIPLAKVIAEIERQYNIKITLDKVDSNRLFTGGFTHDNLEDALIEITHPMDLDYELSASNVRIHGKNN